MADFINFEADDDDEGDAIIDECDPEEQTVSDNEFIDDETQIDESIEDFYAVTNICRSVKDAMRDSYFGLDSSESLQQHERNNYCNDNYDLTSEQIN